MPTPEQAATLTQTIERANAACDFVSGVAWKSRTFKRFDLHRKCYQDIRVRFGLSAQVAVRVIAKVADAYALYVGRPRKSAQSQLDKKSRHVFKAHGCIAYDDRILTWRLTDSTVSVWAIGGRLRVPFVCGAHQRAMLSNRNGESDLVFRGGEFFLLAVCEVAEASPFETVGALGVDLGVRNIAVDSDGEVHTGQPVNNVRHRHRRLRSKLQAKGTKSAKRRLKKLSGKERRFARDINHKVSKQLVAKAQDTRRAIALEDLSGIRTRVTVRRSQRATLHSWAFYQLRAFVAYKAQKAGVPVVLVDARNTSRTCPACGCIDKRNRPTQSQFSCVVCGFAGLADQIAAVNISRRAVVSPPNVSTPAVGEVSPKVSGASYPVLRGGS